MPKHQKEDKYQNIILVIMIVIVVFIIIVFGYYFIRTKQNEKINNKENNNLNETALIQENDIAKTTNMIVNEENEVTQELIIIKTISPRGFSGASNYNLCLYSDKTVYLITYNGEGYTEKDISSKQLLAENVEDIYYDEATGTMYIVGGNKVNDGGVTWIEFK